MFVALMAFFARVSDPHVGGTYMTLLNTLTNLGGNWPATLALWFVDTITVRQCVSKDGASNNSTLAAAIDSNECDGATQTADCESAGGRCVVLREGYAPAFAMHNIAAVRLLIEHLPVLAAAFISIERLILLKCSRYYIESVACVVLGFIWLGAFGWRTIKRLQAAETTEWRVMKKPKS